MPVGARCCNQPDLLFLHATPTSNHFGATLADLILFVKPITTRKDLQGFETNNGPCGEYNNFTNGYRSFMGQIHDLKINNCFFAVVQRGDRTGGHVAQQDAHPRDE